MKKMRKIITMAFVSMIFATTAHAVSWWQQPTICRPNPTNCYASMGSGFDDGMWDTGGNCWGLKMVCPEALTTTAAAPVAMSKSAITAGTGIKVDYDTSMLNGDCFGTRKTNSNGAMASVNGSYVKVWCHGILSSSNETLTNGEITFGNQPTCKMLARDGYIAVLSQNCYGKYYEPNDYYIECSGTNELPTRIVQLNNSDWKAGITGGGYDYPTDTSAAKSIFDKMQSVSAAKRAEYFK
jgi:hypothetical protein